MRKCPACHFRKTQVKTIRHEKDTRLVVETWVVCKNCGKVLKRKKVNKYSDPPNF